MATINFPATPNLNDTYSFNGKTWVWNGSAWDLAETGAINNIIIGNITPAAGTFTTLSATGNVTGTYVLGNVAFATGIPATYGNSNVSTYLASGTDTANIVTTGNITGGNVTTSGLVSVTGNITGGNVITGGGAGGNITGANLISSNNFSGTNATFSKISSTTILETVTLNASAFANPSTYDILTQTVWYSTATASTNFTLNIRGNSSVTANSLLAVGQSMTFSLMVTNTSPAYYPSAFQVDGSAITPKYSGGTAFSAGNANATDVYLFTLIKTAATPTYILLVSQTKFA